MSEPVNIEKTSGYVLKPDQLRIFFTDHLSRIFCAKSHLFERLPELADEAHFKDLKQAVLETWEDIGKQIARIEEIFTLLDEAPSLRNCEELIVFIESGFSGIYHKKENLELRDLSILFYLSVIESVELSSFKLLQMAAVKLPDKRIQQLLKENFDESKADRSLFVLIAARYVN
ncbi:DUF892 family protein [Mucilaginibacter celer]|uniref:DUF892 family protein n=1 Tax=Mucilaginibacter celer TaxID=2305508 RepID=A0A494VPX4_9SPHI|nr:DUF892 family protein [Mucilaginibacter celer]AYL95230.1 DUF892 family protein [Mucilaginibacter celer]